jgi:RHS repeat-associated protein
MRFSSKPWVGHNGSNSDGLYYYGYRFYEPNLQRWLNRDPIEETGGCNVYRFAANNPISRVDTYGLQDGQPETDRCKERCHKWADAVARAGGDGPRALLDCYEGCDRNPAYVPGSPLPPLPKVKPTLPKKPLWTITKECLKLLKEWWKDRKRAESSN